VHVDDLEHVDEKECVWWIEDPTFIYRYVWIGGYPHVALEDLKKLRGKDAEVLGCILEKIQKCTSCTLRRRPSSAGKITVIL
jgi:hypothetical protein